MKTVAIVLTLNEGKHLSRCLQSLHDVVQEVLVVDCFSSDDTVAIAKAHGARVLRHVWVNHAIQFNWALSQLDSDTDWVLRIDADEVMTPELAAEIRGRLPSLASQIEGVFISRRMTFQRQIIRHGGLFPIRVLRLFRYGRGYCENRWMDEHIKVTGPTVTFAGELIDDNLNSLDWWTDKHNRYASREAVDLLNLEYGFMEHDSVASLRGGSQAGLKRWLKERAYARLPGGFRSIVYFIYRYVIRLGFLDGRVGFAFHFLQGFWYRYLVDAKIAEVRRHMIDQDADIKLVIKRVLDVDLAKTKVCDKKSQKNKSHMV